MRYGTRATLTAAAITVMGVAGVAAGLAAGPSRSGPSAPVGSVPGDGSQARVGNVICGQTLTESTIVENDLANCPGDGLVAGADGIAIDLDGHTIDGQTFATGTGIAISGVDGVVVGNGAITGFDVGVSIVFGADGTQVRDLRISDSPTGNGIEAHALRTAVTVVAERRGRDEDRHGSCPCAEAVGAQPQFEVICAPRLAHTEHEDRSGNEGERPAEQQQVE